MGRRAGAHRPGWLASRSTSHLVQAVVRADKGLRADVLHVRNGLYMCVLSVLMRQARHVRGQCVAGGPPYVPRGCKHLCERQTASSQPVHAREKAVQAPRRAARLPVDRQSTITLVATQELGQVGSVGIRNHQEFVAIYKGDPLVPCSVPVPMWTYVRMTPACIHCSAMQGMVESTCRAMHSL